MKKDMRILFSLALFAAFLTACGPESVNNSTNAVKSSTPTPAGTPAQIDLPTKLKNIGVSDVVKPGETKNNADLLAEKLNDYKKNYKSDPAIATKMLNDALNSFGDEDVKKHLPEIKDLAFAEVAAPPPGNDSNAASEKAGFEKTLVEKINPLQEQLKGIDQKIDKNDFPQIAAVLLIQTLVLSVLIIGGCLWLFSGMRHLKWFSKNDPSHYQTGAELSMQRSRAAESAPVDLSKIEGNLATIMTSVDELTRRVTDYETSFWTNFDEYRQTLSNHGINESRGQQKIEGASESPKPCSVEELKVRYKGRYRHLEKENFSDALVVSHGEGTFLVIEIRKEGESAYYIFPNKGRFRNGDEYRNIEHYFDCDSPGAGELFVEKLARVRIIGDRWELQNRGEISIP
jgi:hypothetical protein